MLSGGGNAWWQGLITSCTGVITNGQRGRSRHTTADWTKQAKAASHAVLPSSLSEQIKKTKQTADSIE